MRNGNSISFHSSFVLALGSYPTYEEWKLWIRKNIEEKEIIGSYPTYEEWKH